MIENLLFKAVDYFNGLSAEERTIPEGALYLLTMHHLFNENEDTYVIGKESGNIWDGEYRGYIQLLWVDLPGVALTATPASFLILSTDPVVTSDALVVLHEIAPTNAGPSGDMMDAEWVANNMEDHNPAPDYETKINVLAMGGDGAQQEMWLTNPTYVGKRFGNYQLEDTVFRIRPLYTFEQFTFKLPNLDAALATGGDDLILAPMVSLKRLCFDGDALVQLSYNAQTTDAPDSNGLTTFELWRLPSDIPPSLGNLTDGMHILSVYFNPTDPHGTIYHAVQPTESNVQTFKRGLDGQYFWIWPSDQQTSWPAANTMTDVSFTVKTKVLNEYSDMVTAV